MVTESQKKAGIIVGGIAVIIAFLLFTGNFPFLSILASSQNVQIGTDGQYFTVQTLKVTNGDLATYRVTAANGFTMPNGTKLQNGSDVVVTISPNPQKCEYILTPKSSLLSGNYYTVGNPTRTQTLTISTDKSTGTAKAEYKKSQTIDAFGSQTLTLLASDGHGVLSVESNGAFVGGQDCPQGDYAVINNGGKPIVVNRVDFEAKERLLSCADMNFAQCLAALNDLAGQRFTTSATQFTEFADVVNGITFDSQKTKLLVYPRAGSFAYPSVTIYADEKFMNFVRVAPLAPLVNPTVKGISEGNVVEGEKLNYVLYINNPSDFKKTFSGTISTSMGSISPSPSFATSEIAAHGDGSVIFVYQAPSVTSDTTFTISGQICDTYSGQSKCSPYSVTRTIKNKADSIIPTPVPDAVNCGDGVCSKPSEDYGTCPKDCEADVTPTPVDCSLIENSHKSNNECVCNDGFVTNFNTQTGAKTCQAPAPDWMAYVPYVIIGAIVIGGGYMIFKPKGGKRK